jgi:hypothetical protein
MPPHLSAALIEMARYRMVRSTGLVQKFIDAGELCVCVCVCVGTSA